MKKVIKNFLIVLILIYLLISSIYIFVHIDFNKPPMIVGMGFSEKNNIIRTFFGLPPTYTTYKGVSPYYFIHILFRVLLIVILLRVLFKNNKKDIS